MAKKSNNPVSAISALAKKLYAAKKAKKWTDAVKMASQQLFPKTDSSAQSVAERHRRKIERQNKRMPKPIRDVLNNPVYSWDISPIDNPGFKIVGRANEALDLILKKFSDPESLPEPLAQVFATKSGDTHASKLSLMNRLVIAFFGEYEAMGFRQWEKFGRRVKKGAKGIPILAPIKVMREREVKMPDGKTDKETYPLIVGFKHVIVFGLSQTEGKPYEVTKSEFIKHLPFVEVAEQWGINLATYGGSSSGALGYYSPEQKTIALGVENHSTFTHELVHVSDHRLGTLKVDKYTTSPKVRQDAEVVAEIGGATLLYAVGLEKEADLGGAYKYVKGWSPEGDPRLTAFRLLDRIMKAVDNVIQEAEAIQQKTGKMEKVANPDGIPRTLSSEFLDYFGSRNTAELSQNKKFLKWLKSVAGTINVQWFLEDRMLKEGRAIGTINVMSGNEKKSFAFKDTKRGRVPTLIIDTTLHHNPFLDVPLTEGLAVLAKATSIDVAGEKRRFGHSHLIGTADRRWLIISPDGRMKMSGPAPKEWEASKAFKEFRHYPPSRRGAIDIPELEKFRYVGEISEIEYDSDKMIFATDQRTGRKKNRPYVHRFDKPTGVYAYAGYYIIGRLGKRTTARGIEA